MVGDQSAPAHVLEAFDSAVPAGEEERAVGLVRVGKAAVGDGEEVARAFGQVAARDARRGNEVVDLAGKEKCRAF